MTRVALFVLVAAVVAGCGATTKPKEDPGVFAKQVLGLIVHNKYSAVWVDLQHPVDQQVAPFSEYVGCENRNPVIAAPRTMKVLTVNDESIGIGNGKFVDSKAVGVRLGFAGDFKVTHTVHLVADHGK